MHHDSFQALKQALCSAPVLAVPDFTKPFAIETDTSASGVGAVLVQSGHPLAFISKPLGPRTQGLSTYEKEYLAILLAVQQWRHYLQAAEFIIYTDQKSLIHLNEQRLHTHWQQRVFTKLLGFHYKIVYKKGSDNGVADALSRRVHTQAQVHSISTIVPSWLAELQSSYSSDPNTMQMISKLTLDNHSIPSFSLVDGILRYKNQIYLGQLHPYMLK